MFYSIDIGNNTGSYNTWSDWQLIPTSRPLVSVPETKIKMVEIPGGHGSLDLTDILGGTVRYGTRKGSWEFAVANPNVTIDGLDDYINTYDGEGYSFARRQWHTNIGILSEDERPWIKVYSNIMRYVHGRTSRVRLSDDPDFYYWGRISVNEWRSEEKYSVVVLDYEFQPFKFHDGADPEKASKSEEYGGVL